MKCKNCDFSFEGNFCSNCGQKAKTERINLRHLLKDISENILQVNKGFLFTFKELSIRPGNAIKEFVTGKRVKYTKPLSYLFIITMIYVIFAFIGVDIFLNELLSGVAGGLQDDGNTSLFAVPLLKWMINNFAYSNLLLIPLFSLASFIVFIKSKFNYSEHFVLNIYIASQQIVIDIIFALFVFFINTEYPTIYFSAIFLKIIYKFWVYSTFFHIKNIFIRSLLFIATYLLFLIFIGLSITAVMFVDFALG